MPLDSRDIAAEVALHEKRSLHRQISLRERLRRIWFLVLLASLILSTVAILGLGVAGLYVVIVGWMK